MIPEMMDNWQLLSLSSAVFGTVIGLYQGAKDTASSRRIFNRGELILAFSALTGLDALAADSAKSNIELQQAVLEGTVMTASYSAAKVVGNFLGRAFLYPFSIYTAPKQRTLRIKT